MAAAALKCGICHIPISATHQTRIPYSFANKWNCTLNIFSFGNNCTDGYIFSTGGLTSIMSRGIELTIGKCHGYDMNLNL